MPVIESSEHIKRRLQQEAARQWGYQESEIDSGGFDPLIDLLMGAFAVEVEKIGHEIETSRSRILDRLIEVLLPEAWSNTLPAHSVLMAQPTDSSTEVMPTSQFFAVANEPIYFSPAGTFPLVDGSVQVVAIGTKIDKIGFQYQGDTTAYQYKRETIELSPDKVLPSDECWLGLELTDEIKSYDSLCFFFNWPTPVERNKYLPYLPDILFYAENELRQERMIQTEIGIDSISSKEEKNTRENLDFTHTYEKQVREFYRNFFLTLTNLPETTLESQAKRYPSEWESRLDMGQQARFLKNLYWIKLKCPAALTGDALAKMEVSLNCFPVLNRKLNRQQGKLQPLFNVFGLTEEDNLWGVQRVLNGDGLELMPVEQKEMDNRQNVYALRKRALARFDQRDAFETLNDLMAKMRDDMAAFEALDNTILSNHLSVVNRNIAKIKEHLTSFTIKFPSVYLLIRTKSSGNIMEVYYWTTLGIKANDLIRLKKLQPEQAKLFSKEPIALMLPSSGGRDRMKEDQKRKSFREVLLTRGRAVTTEDFRTITRGLVGTAASKIDVQKQLSIGDAAKQGLRRILEVIITPNPAEKHNEEYWLQRCHLVKTMLEERSTGVLPLVVSVTGYKWKI